MEPAGNDRTFSSARPDMEPDGNDRTFSSAQPGMLPAQEGRIFSTAPPGLLPAGEVRKFSTAPPGMVPASGVRKFSAAPPGMVPASDVRKISTAQPGTVPASDVRNFSTAPPGTVPASDVRKFSTAQPGMVPASAVRNFSTAPPGMVPAGAVSPCRPARPLPQHGACRACFEARSNAAPARPNASPSPSRSAGVRDDALSFDGPSSGPVVMQGSNPTDEGLGLGANRSLSSQPRLSQYQQVPMAGRPPPSNQHYNPQQFAAAANTTASPMMVAQQQRPGQMQQQQQRPTAAAAAQASQIRAGGYLQQTQQYPSGQYVHHMGSVPINNVNQARPGVQGGIAPAAGTAHYGNMQNLGVAQQHNMQARQKPNQGQAPSSHYIGAMQQQNLGPTRQGVTLAPQQQQQQQQLSTQHQTLQQQQLSAQQRLGPQQQQAMARQTQGQQMMQNQGNTMLARGSSTGAQMQGISPGPQQQAMYAMGKPAQYQQHQQQQPQQQPQPQQVRPQMVTTSLATNQARPGTPGAAAQTNNALPSSVPATAANTEPLDATGSLLGKRSIHDLLAQIDPRERLDPDVEEVMLEIADDFIESVASFAVKLAKHRKSNVLEAKDVLLHLDKQWNITVPGFGGDEYRSYKRPSVSETHKQRLAVVRKSAAAGQAAAESKALSAAPATNAATPVKSGLSGLGTGPVGSPSPSPGMPRIPRV